jgi:GNAT superfamily N-acetyltransferase
MDGETSVRRAAAADSVRRAHAPPREGATVPDVREIDPHDEDALRAWYRACRAGSVAERTAPLVFAYEEVRASLRNPKPTALRRVFGSFDGDTLAGALRLDLPLRENRDLADWTLAVPPEHRRRGHGGALFAFGQRFASEHGRTVHDAEVDVPRGRALDEHPGSRFALRHGFASRHREDRLVLELPVPPPRLDALRDNGTGYDFVSWVGACPDEHAEDFVRMRNIMEHDVPTGEAVKEAKVWTAERLRDSEESLAAQGFTTVITAARHPEHGFCGYSLMFVPTHTPGEVYQDDTLVVRAHRGHRLGGAMKTRNLDILRRDHPDRRRVHTWTAGDNAPMRKVNADFGFAVVETMHEFQRADAAA